MNRFWTIRVTSSTEKKILFFYISKPSAGHPPVCASGPERFTWSLPKISWYSNIEFHWRCNISAVGIECLSLKYIFEVTYGFRTSLSNNNCPQILYIVVPWDGESRIMSPRFMLNYSIIVPKNQIMDPYTASLLMQLMIPEIPYDCILLFYGIAC